MLSPGKWQIALVYLEDIVIFLPGPHQQIEHGTIVFHLLKLAGATLKLEKYQSFTDKFHLVGFVIWPGRQKKDLNIPITINGLQNLKNDVNSKLTLSLLNEYWRLDSDFTPTTTPLHKKLPKRRAVELDKISMEELRAVTNLQQKRVSLLFLAWTKRIGHITLATDVCSQHIDCVLVQSRGKHRKTGKRLVRIIVRSKKDMVKRKERSLQSFWPSYYPDPTWKAKHYYMDR